MSEQKSTEYHSTSSPSSDSTPPIQRMTQNFFLVWIDANVDESNADLQSSLAQLRSVVNDVATFKQQDDAIDYLTDVPELSSFLIVTDTMGAQLLPLIHDIPLLHTIYILARNQHQDAKWTEKWGKVNGIYTDVPSICKALQVATKQCDHDSIAVSFISIAGEVSNINLNQLEPSFMYTQLFKEILFEMEDEQKSIRILTDYCRQFYQGNPRELRIIDEFAVSYRPESAIWWYTRECFIYRMLNRALRSLDGDIIINIGFFIRHLHRQIQQLHCQQVKDYNENPFTVYRGQALSKQDFENLMKIRGGLMSFNSFLSTTKEREISLRFARKGCSKTDTIGILFRIIITPSVSSTPFASIGEQSYYKTEEETLFSMHSVFRVTDIIKIDAHESLYQADLTLTSDDDHELRTLTSRIWKEIVGTNCWDRLGNLLIKLNQLDKAEEIYTHLHQQTHSLHQEATNCRQLGRIKTEQGNYDKATEYYTKSHNMLRKSLPANHPSLATSYDNMAELYCHKGEYSKTLLFFEKAFEIRQKNLPANHPDLATSYNNMAAVYWHMGEYSKALSLYERALEMLRKSLPANHPDLATSYSNMAAVYCRKGEYSKALSFYEKALEIRHKTLPADHPDLATSYNNMAAVYCHMEEYSKALSLYERALEMLRKSLPANHPSLATSYNNIAGVYCLKREYSKALSFFEKAFEMLRKSLPANHPSLAISYHNMAEVYCNMGEYSKALSFFEKALEMQRKTLPANHPSLAITHHTMAGVYCHKGDYSKALSLYERALEMLRESLPANHPDLATSYNNIAGVYCHKREYSKALSFYEKALEIRHKTLPANHPGLATYYTSVGSVHYMMGSPIKSLSYFERAREICQVSLPANHPTVKQTLQLIAVVKRNM